MLCILNQNRLLFKENPISNGFNLEKQLKTNKSLGVGPRKALWPLHFLRPGSVVQFRIAANSSSEIAAPGMWDGAPGRFLGNSCPEINYP